MSCFSLLYELMFFDELELSLFATMNSSYLSLVNTIPYSVGVFLTN